MRSRGVIDKGSEHHQTGVLALLGVELRPEDIASLYAHRDRGAAEDNGRGLIDRIAAYQPVAVDKIEWGFSFHRGVKSRYSSRGEVAPADVRHMLAGSGRHSDDPAANETQPLVTAEFFALLGEQLHAETDAQDWRAGGSCRLDGFDQAIATQARHPVTERPNARQQQGRRISDRMGICRHAGSNPDTLQRGSHRAEIGDRAFNNSDHLWIVRTLDAAITEAGVPIRTDRSRCSGLQ